MSNLSETRYAYGEALLELGRQRRDVVVLDTDLFKSTRSVLFRDAFPDRFFDLGIAEADMVSTAAGMAASGLVPYCNSFSVFLTGVCYMPVRTQIAYPALPVKLIGSSSGLTQGPDGASHQSLEDISLMRTLPNMTVISPCDDVETRQATLAIADWPGPVRRYRVGAPHRGRALVCAGRGARRRRHRQVCRLLGRADGGHGARCRRPTACRHL